MSVCILDRIRNDDRLHARGASEGVACYGFCCIEECILMTPSYMYIQWEEGRGGGREEEGREGRKEGGGVQFHPSV